MKFKIGDKVKFLNDNGGGVVSKIISASLVNIQIEDGFEIPTLVSELVLANELENFERKRGDFFTSSRTAAAAPEPEKEDPVFFDDRISKLRVFKAKGDDKKGLYLAYVPQDQRWLLTGLIDVYLVNFTGYEVLFSLFLRKENGAWEGRDYDAIPSDSRLLLASIHREEIERWSYGVIQALYHKELSDSVLAPVNSTFSFKPARLYRENVYIDSSFLQEKAFLFLINEIAIQKTVAERSEDEKHDEEIAMQHAKPQQSKEIIDKHKTSPREAVVDLHIGELTDDYSKMSNQEMLNVQLNYFVRCLEGAIKSYLTKVTFIHGVGDGILKSKIMEILKAYENVKTRDASKKDFGYGATEVLIWHSSS
ncbi:MAG: DUF2027 domain-containing protein [Bacteroidales bacterium]|jgi:hypothetical protein|nr:DUF2027 domain-containing protein [Bacteroidales bacterium]NLO51086.1 DUF2027 domain-containing protein [Bacteroidales bacterium]